MKQVSVICPYCGVGCGMYLKVKDEKVVGIEYMLEHPVNEGKLCPKGNSAIEVIYNDERLLYPLKKENGKFKRISWEEALTIVSHKLQEIKNLHTAQSLAFLASAKCTNEENYLFQKLARILGTNNIDCCARLCHGPSVVALSQTLGSGAMTNPLTDFENSKCIFIIGSNPAENHPVSTNWILKAKDKGAKIIVADVRYTPTAWLADIFLQIKPGIDIALIYGMLWTIIKENLYNENFISSRTTGFDDLKKKIEEYPPERVEKITGIPYQKIADIARIYAKSPASSIVYCMGVTQHTTGVDNVIMLSNLALVTGHIGREGTGVNPLRGQNNVQGACDMGALSVFCPGYCSVVDKAGRERIANIWGVEYLPENPGLTVVEMTHAIDEGKIKGMYIMGENPSVSDPNTMHLREAFKKLEFLVVQDIFLTETAQLADIVLPACSFAEKEGTVVNTERRVQWTNKAIAPQGESKPDWEILILVAKKLGLEKYFNFSTPAEILREINKVVLQYKGITPERVKATIGGIPWPCPDETHCGTPILHCESFRTPDCKGKIIPVDYKPPYEETTSEYPFILTTGRTVIHYNSGSMTRRTNALLKREKNIFVEINTEDASKLNIKNGDMVKISTRRGESNAVAKVTNNIAKGVVFLPFHFEEANVLTTDALDPKAKMPELKVASCRIEKI